METSITTRSADAVSVGCVAVAVYEGRRLSASAKRLDGASSGRLGALLEQSPLEGKTGQQLLLFCPSSGN